MPLPDGRLAPASEPVRLSEHFTLAEMLASDTADRLKIKNAPRLEHVRQLCRLAEVLEGARFVLGVPLRITSGYRCPKLNAAVGSSDRSAHPDGRAADFVPVGAALDDAFERIRKSDLDFDQLIIERTKTGKCWLHLGIAREGATPRRQALRADDASGSMTYRIAEG